MFFLGKLLIFTAFCWQLFSIKELLILMPVFYLIYLSIQEFKNNTEFTIKKSLMLCTLSCFIIVILLFQEYWSYIYTSFKLVYLKGTKSLFITMVLFTYLAPYLGYLPCGLIFLRNLDFWTSLNTFEDITYWLTRSNSGELNLKALQLWDRQVAPEPFNKLYLNMYWDFVATSPEVAGPFFSNFGTFLLSSHFDALNLTFITLVAFLAPLCIFWLWQDTNTINQQIFLFLFLFLLFGMLGAFASVDFFFFFFFLNAY